MQTPGASDCARGNVSCDHGALPAQPSSSSVGPEQVEPPELPFELEESLELLGELELLELLEPLEPLELPESPPPELLGPLPAWATLRVVSAGAA